MSGPHKVKVTTIGDSVGIILPDEVVARLGVRAGSSFVLTETPNGYELAPDHEAEFEEIMEVARKVARKYRNALRQLAKS